mmetsp:Transcript_2159/g.4063  ORF Transcript_2159/g.4063 Transcript_2159/m.4063 type:complete len:1370 (-) Transcript_2159:285-4394(-)
MMNANPTPMSVIVTNSKTKGITKENVDKAVKVYPYQAIFRSSSYALASFKQIAPTLLEVEIRRCELTTGDILIDCVNVRVVCLADNDITLIPPCIQKLTHLDILDFSHNEISSLKDVSNLKNAPSSLTYVNLIGNTVTSVSSYRKNIFKLAPSLCALDLFAFTDADTLSYKSPFSRVLGSSRRQKLFRTIDRMFYSIQLKDTQEQVIRHIDNKCTAIKRIRKLSSAAYAIQARYRVWVSRKKDYIRYQHFVGTIIKLQAIVRCFLFSRKLQREVDAITNGENITLQLTQTMARVNQIDTATRKIQCWARLCLLRHRRYRASATIQQWFRRAIVYHNGVLRWMRKFNVTGIVFTQPYLRLIKQKLSAYPTKYVKVKQIQAINDNMRLFGNHLVCVRPKDQYLFYRQQSLKRISAPIDGRLKMSRTSMFSLSYASAIQQKRCHLLKRRGVYYQAREGHAGGRVRGMPAPGMQTVQEEFITNNHRVFRIGIENPSDLLKVFKYLQKGQPSLSVYFDVVLVRNACAIDIQRVWRSFVIRKLVAPMCMTAVINRRSVIVVQRWWKNINNFKRRLNLLRSINLACRSITSPTVFMDAWVYYHLLRCYSRPQYQLDAVSMFPEFKGIPVFDDKGHIAIQPCVTKKSVRRKSDNNDNDRAGQTFDIPTVRMAIELPVAGRVVREGKARMCIPRWASWRPQQQLPPIGQPLLSHHLVMFSLLTMHCDVAVRSFDVPFKKSHNLKKIREIRFVELTFASALDAQIRCAMLMLLTYDPRRHSSISMMHESDLRIRLRNKSDDIINGRVLAEEACAEVFEMSEDEDPVMTDDDDHRELCPIETQVLLTTPTPDWLLDISPEVPLAETVRFQFMCECLAVKEVVRAKTAREHFEESIQNNEDLAWSGVTVENDNGGDHDKPLRFVPLEAYAGSDDVMDIRVPLTMSSVETEVFPAAYTQQLLPVPKPILTPRRPQSAAPSTTMERRHPIDSRFKEKLWSKERVLLWCSNFDDTSPESTFAPRRPITSRPFSARDSRSRATNNANCAAESRLHMVTLSTAAKNLGKFRVDDIPEPLGTPPKMKRDVYMAEQAAKKKRQVHEYLISKLKRDDQRAACNEYELSCKREQVRQIQSAKSNGAATFSEWRALKSANANSRVSESLNSAKLSAALHTERKEERKSALVQDVKDSENNAKIARQVRKKTLGVTCTLNAIATKMTKKDHQRETKNVSNRQHMKIIAGRVTSAPPTRGIKQKPVMVCFDNADIRRGPPRNQYASSIKDLLQARVQPAEPTRGATKQVEDDDHSLSLCSEMEGDKDRDEDLVSIFNRDVNKTRKEKGARRSEKKRGDDPVAVMSRRDMANRQRIKSRVSSAAFNDSMSCSPR